jgi:molybdenum cofactor cytidylyltransferase
VVDARILVRRDTAAIVLPAGASTRMGRPKLVMPYGASTIIGTVVDTIRSSAVGEIVVVTGYHSEAVADAIPAGVATAHNENAEAGNLSSLLVGLDAVGGVDGVIVVVGDMPDVSAASVDRLLALWETSDVLFGSVQYTDGQGHPLLIDRSLFDTVRTLGGTRPLWSYAESLAPPAVGTVDVDRPKPTDINSMEGYLAALEALDQG